MLQLWIFRVSKGTPQHSQNTPLPHVGQQQIRCVPGAQKCFCPGAEGPVAFRQTGSWLSPEFGGLLGSNCTSGLGAIHHIRQVVNVLLVGANLAVQLVVLLREVLQLLPSSLGFSPRSFHSLLVLLRLQAQRS